VDQALQNRVVVPGDRGRYLVQIAIVFAAQFVAGKIGDLFLTANNGGIGPVWPASGIALAALLLCGYSVWPAVAVGAFLLVFLAPLPLWAASAYAAGTTLAALVGAFLLRHTGFDNSVSRLKDALGFMIFGAFGSSLVGASIGASVLYRAHMRGWSEFSSAWLIYWLGDSTGVLLITPLALTFLTLFRIRDQGRATELATLLLLLTVACLAVFGDLPFIPVRLHVLAFALLPFVMWAAIRFGVSATALSILIIATVATVETALGSGPFATNAPFTNALLLDVFFAVLSVSGLTLAAVIAEREHAERQREQLTRQQAATEARLRADEAVRESEERLRLAARAGKMYAYEWDVATDAVVRSEESTNILGSTGEPTCVTRQQLLARVHPDDRAKFIAAVADLTPENPTTHITYRVFRAGRSVIWLEKNGRAFFDAQGRMLRMIGIVADITERKRTEEQLQESEERFRLVATTAPVMIWMSGPDKLCTYFNQPWLTFTGRSIHQELGNGWAEGVDAEDLERCLETYKQAFDQRKPFEMEYRLRRHDGEYRWIFDQGVPRFNADGSFAGYIGSASDVTDQKLAREVLEKVSGQLIEAQEKERRRLARELHDDICQRLAMISLKIEKATSATSKGHVSVADQLEQIWQQCSKLTGDVQALSHELHPSILDNLGLVTAVRSFCREVSEQREVVVDFVAGNVPDSLPSQVSLSLYRVVQEALRNAVKYSGVKQFAVELSGTAEEVQLVVRDAGAGFDVEEARRNGGLGLVSMEERINLVHGRLRVQSRPGEGTKIVASVSLPAENGRPFAVAAQNQAKSASAGAS